MEKLVIAMPVAALGVSVFATSKASADAGSCMTDRACAVKEAGSCCTIDGSCKMKKAGACSAKTEACADKAKACGSDAAKAVEAKAECTGGVCPLTK